MMEQNTLQTIDIRRIQALAPLVDEYALGTDFILGAVSGKRVEKSEALLRMLKYPVRFDGYILFFLKKGHFSLDVNLSTYDIHPNSLLVVVPGNIVKLSAYDEDHIGDAELLFALVSKDFLSSVRFDFNKVFQDTIRMWNWPRTTSALRGSSSPRTRTTNGRSWAPSLRRSPMLRWTYGRGSWPPPARPRTPHRPG